MSLRTYDLQKACFACTTPYQVLGAISIVRSEKLCADIYIFSMFSGYLELAQRLIEMHLFENVIVVDCDKVGPLSHCHAKSLARIKAFIQITFPARCLREYVGKKIAYECFYSSSRAHVKLLLQKVLQKRNPKMNVVIYDDGLGSYLVDSHVLRTSKLRKKAEKFLGWDLFVPNQVSIQLYLPSIAQLPTELRQYPISQMPRIDWNASDERALIKLVFGTTERIQYPERVILFDNVRGAESRKHMFEQIDQCFAEIVDLAGQNNVAYKPHPRSREKSHVPCHEIIEQGTPMEILYSEMNDLESRILIAYNSTATYTPKLLFGAEPWVVNLHRIVGPPLQENAETLYQTFLPTYNNKGKLLAPNNMQELREILKKILKE